jgi:alpha-glucosidase
MNLRMGSLRDWRRSVIYEIYVRSFRDSDGDGLGDLRGVIDSVPYLRDLAVDAIWLSPIHPSPDRDLGYDVSDYVNVDPRLGSLAEFDALVRRAHESGIAVILDWVVNHTSDRHPWFGEARASIANSRRDWYIFRPGRGAGQPPSNWRSMFGGSAWTYDKSSGEWYLHTFLPEQPDLNWRNEEVREAIASAMRVWLERGVDGFRLDVLPLFIKDDRLRDNPLNGSWRPGMSDYRRLQPVWTVDQPEMERVLAFLRGVMDAFPDRVLLAEMGLPPERAARYHLAIDVPLNFGLITDPWNAERLERRIRAYLEALPAGAWANWVLGNHDVSRVATRLGEERARAAAVILMTLPGTLTLYYGDELGLPDHPSSPRPARDSLGRIDPARSRDPQRAPMAWDTSPGGGFSTDTPWLPPYPDFAERSVASQQDDPRSTLALYLRLLALRREHPDLATGAMRELRAVDGALYYERHGTRRHAIIARLSDTATLFTLPSPCRPLISSLRPELAQTTIATIELAGPEAVVVEML